MRKLQAGSPENFAARIKYTERNEFSCFCFNRLNLSLEYSHTERRSDSVPRYSTPVQRGFDLSKKQDSLSMTVAMESKYIS